jgi:GH15 family glucan-1,4-alpha-glucosidase
MPLRIEDYGIVGDLHSTALVGYDASVDWLCLPRVDSGACFAALLGSADNGYWRLGPAGEHRTLGRRYRPDTLVLETDLASDEGAVRVVDFMPPRENRPRLLRYVECLQGSVTVRSEVSLRLDYGHIVPWLQGQGRRVRAFAGPEAVTVDAEVAQHVVDDTIVAEARLSQGDSTTFALEWAPVREQSDDAPDVRKLLARTTKWWQDWSGQCRYTGDYRDAVVRSLITLKALAYAPSGGIVAAATTSLPEQLGGVRNWDYRYCWLRDATFTLMALLEGGYESEAVAWRKWLLRALAGRPEQMQIMYGVEGERRLTETELDWLPGYADSRPVRIGNAASGQFQLDVYGELMDSLHQARAHGIPPDEDAWHVQQALMDFLEGHWRDRDDGIWEMRGPPRDFTYSKVMAWVAVDRAVKAVGPYGFDEPVDRWKQLREEIFDDVCKHGYDRKRGTFTQYYGSKALDASLLLMAPVGFLPADDKRIVGTVAAIEKELCSDGFVQRYTMNAQTEKVDGLPPGEGAFLACTFWLADNYVLQGQVDKGKAVFERLLSLRNDLGLLSEEYDVSTGRLIGNVPQAFSHVPLVNTASNLASARGVVHRRSETGTQDRRKK